MLEIALAAAKQAELSVKCINQPFLLVLTRYKLISTDYSSGKDIDGTCTEMEGASIGHVATMNKVPYLVIRAISDKADDSAEMDYPSFAAMAINNSVALMTEFIKLC